MSGIHPFRSAFSDQLIVQFGKAGLVYDENHQLFGSGLQRDDDGGEASFPWNVRGVMFRPTMTTFQKFAASAKKAAYGQDTFLKFLFEEEDTQPTNPLISIRNIRNAGKEGEMVLLLRRTKTEDNHIIEVNFPYKVAYFNVLRRYFQCQTIDMRSLPAGIEVFAYKMGLHQMFEAIFLGWVKTHFGPAAKRTLDLEGVLQNLISYYEVIDKQIPKTYLDAFCRTLVAEYDKMDHAKSLRGGRVSLFLFLLEQNQVPTLVQMASDVGSRPFMEYLLELVLKCHHFLREEELRYVLGRFDWRISSLQVTLQYRDGIDSRIWRSLALSRSDMRIPKYPVSVTQLRLPFSLAHYKDMIYTKDPTCSVLNPSLEEIEAGDVPYQGFRVYHKRIFSLFLIKRDELLVSLLLFIRPRFTNIFGWEGWTRGEVLPEVSLIEKDCTCFEGPYSTVRWGRMYNQEITLYERIRRMERSEGYVVVLLQRNDLLNWLQEHSSSCSLLLRINLISDPELKRREMH